MDKHFSFSIKFFLIDFLRNFKSFQSNSQVYILHVTYSLIRCMIPSFNSYVEFCFITHSSQGWNQVSQNFHVSDVCQFISPITCLPYIIFYFVFLDIHIFSFTKPLFSVEILSQLRILTYSNRRRKHVSLSAQIVPRTTSGFWQIIFSVHYFCLLPLLFQWHCHQIKIKQKKLIQKTPTGLFSIKKLDNLFVTKHLPYH